MLAEPNPLLHLVNTLVAEGEVLVFLGAGSSTEGWQGSDPYPDFMTLVRRVLASEGLHSTEDEMSCFLEVMRRWEKESVLSARLAEYLYGNPGFCHFQLASATMSLFPNVNMAVYLTTNFDDLMFKALTSVARESPHRDPRIFSLTKSALVSDVTNLFRAIPSHSRKGAPVILKLFGDLNFNSPIFHAGDMPFDEFTESKLVKLFDRPILFIGYGLHDAPVLRLLAASKSSYPVFVVSPVNPVDEGLAPLCERSFYWIPKPFSDFIAEFIEVAAIKVPAFEPAFANFLRRADASLLVGSRKAIQSLARSASAPARSRQIHRARSADDGGRDCSPEPVERRESGPDFAGFRRSHVPILAIVGESGSGKSTMISQLYDAPAGDRDVLVYYDAQSVQSIGSVAHRLAADFMTEPSRLTDALARIGDVLAREDGLLVILVDALNESSGVDPLSLRYDIESLAAAAPTNVRFVYTCRRVFWEARMDPANDLPAALYWGRKPFLLSRFSPTEAELAYARHQHAFELQTDYGALSAAVRHHIRDPLMLRFVAEAYRRAPLPQFAPAAIVFRRVLDALRRRYRHSPLIDYLEHLIDERIDRFRSDESADNVYSYREARTDGTLAMLAQQQLDSASQRIHPLTILEDENVISPIDNSGSRFKFTYERFYEYLLGLRLSERLFAASEPDFVRTFGAEIRRFRLGHYSFYQGLRNAFVIQYLRDESPHSRRNIAMLAHHPDPAVAAFGRDVLREVIFEADADAVEVLSDLDESAETRLMLLLELGFEAEAILPHAAAALFHADVGIRRRGAACLLAHVRKFDSLQRASTVVRQTLDDHAPDVANPAAGVTYFSAVLLAACPSIPAGLSAVSDLVSHAVSAWPARCGLPDLAHALAVALETEGPLFFGANYDAHGLFYPWSARTDELEGHRRNIRQLLTDPGLPALNAHFETVAYFSEIRVQNRVEGASRLFAFQIEYRIIQWLLIRLWRTAGAGMMAMLDRLVDGGRPFHIDFALGVVELAILDQGDASAKQAASARAKMREWLDRFEASNADFYLALSEPDPFSFNFTPLAMLARVEGHFFSAESEAIPSLIEWLASSSEERRKMALLAANWLAMEFPTKILATLAPFAKDERLAEWIDRVLSGFEAHSPRLLDEFLDEMRFSTLRRAKIRGSQAALLPQIQYRVDTLLPWLFLESQAQLLQVAAVYDLAYRTDTPHDFCLALLSRLVETAAQPSNQAR